jgi:hypothetical protein
MPKSFSEENNKNKGPKSEIDLSIEQAEQSQNKEESDEQVESHIAGSENLWEASAEMHQITGKLTRDKNYKSPKQLKKEKIQKEKAERERIRQEILQTEPVNDQDLKEFSGYLAQQSSKSKSDLEIHEEKQKK